MRKPLVEKLLTPVLLQALRDCGRSTRVGQADKGNPRKLAQLASLKMVTEHHGGGYVITDLGRQYLSQNRQDLFKL